MSKTDKELAIEAANNYINAWNNATTRTNPLKATEYVDLIKVLHETIQNLPDKK